MQIIPIQSAPNQTLTVTLDGQTCQIDIYVTFFGIFVDLYVSNTLVIGGVQALNLNRIVRDDYLGFSGDLAFIDTQGTSDPEESGLGDRYVLAYLSASEL